MVILTRMKTTVEIPDEIFHEAKSLAARQRTTLRSLIEEGLRWVLSQRRRGDAFVLRDAAVDGRGVRDEIDEGNWEEMRDRIYRGRGG